MKTIEKAKPASLFGTYPKKISCQCNVEEVSDEMIVLAMNGRCPVCNHLYRITIPKASMTRVVLPRAA